MALPRPEPGPEEEPADAAEGCVAELASGRGWEGPEPTPEHLRPGVLTGEQCTPLRLGSFVRHRPTLARPSPIGAGTADDAPGQGTAAMASPATASVLALTMNRMSPRPQAYVIAGVVGFTIRFTVRPPRFTLVEVVPGDTCWAIS